MIVKVFHAKIKGEMLTDAYRCTEILTFGRFPNSGFSKHPHLLAHRILVTSGIQQSICLAKPRGKSVIKTGGEYFADKHLLLTQPKLETWKLLLSKTNNKKKNKLVRLKTI